MDFDQGYCQKDQGFTIEIDNPGFDAAEVMSNLAMHKEWRRDDRNRCSERNIWFFLNHTTANSILAFKK